LNGFHCIALRDGIFLHNNYKPGKMSAKFSTRKRVRMCHRSAVTTP
jgi:hypothetical protein